jgi:hypothetical protein
MGMLHNRPINKDEIGADATAEGDAARNLLRLSREFEKLGNRDNRIRR